MSVQKNKKSILGALLNQQQQKDTVQNTPPKGIYKIEGTVKNYSWGSPVLLPELLNIPNPDQKPFAELWLGTHAGGISHLTDGGLLDTLIGSKSGFFLGTAACAPDDSRLPFLMKVLAAEKPLSLQAHPGWEQARIGYARENALGIPFDAPDRNYKDPHPKPEIICALTQFTALCGFRPLSEIKKMLNIFGCPFLASLVPVLNSDASEKNIYMSFLQTLFSFSDDLREALCGYIMRYAQNLILRHSEHTAVWKMILSFAEAYPSDPAVIAPLYLNIISLEPGEAFFVPAGILHSYVRGLGIELMGASDNVLRGGLTSKYVDPRELVSVLHAAPFCPEKIIPSADTTQQNACYSYAAEAPFTLSVMNVKAKQVGFPLNGPALAFVCKGTVLLNAREGRETLTLKQGESAFIAAGEPRSGMNLRSEFTDTAVLYLASLTKPV
ncbi:MAG: mannose-6-phosphate isomerase, class I [Spirochaetaceae bacterium]|jgi:mannose-6-phosphate isomerase|nr:mannose-6-phosphate isomerase, class I [Spirochaetaceae bacterium]